MSVLARVDIFPSSSIFCYYLNVFILSVVHYVIDTKNKLAEMTKSLCMGFLRLGSTTNIRRL